MKKLLSVLLVLTVTSLASASTVWVQDPAPGEPGSEENPLMVPSEEIVILVYSDTGLIGLDAILTLSGPATIVDAMKPADAPAYGWEPGWPLDPIYGPWNVEIAGANWSGNYNTIVGYITVHNDGWMPPPYQMTLVVSIAGGMAHGGSTDVYYQVPDFIGTAEIHMAIDPGPNCWDNTECAGQPFGDGTCDGQIDLADLFALKEHFGKCGPLWSLPECCSDYDQTGCIDLADLFILKANFGTSGYAPSTGRQNCPEPGAL